MQLEIKTEGIAFAVSRLPQHKNDNEGRQKADRKSGELLFTTEVVAMDDTGAEVIKVTTAGEPKVVKRQGVAVRRLVATPWNVDGRGVAGPCHAPPPGRPPARSGARTGPAGERAQRRKAALDQRKETSYGRLGLARSGKFGLGTGPSLGSMLSVR